MLDSHWIEVDSRGNEYIEYNKGPRFTALLSHPDASEVYAAFFWDGKARGGMWAGPWETVMFRAIAFNWEIENANS